MDKNSKIYRDALAWHSAKPIGAFKIEATKKITTQSELSLAYSPGVAAPCIEIKEDKNKAYLYTGKGNIVAMISNGSAVLGLGNIGALASKPVMEGKSLLMREFGYVNTVDIEVDTVDVKRFVDVVSAIGETWGGINLEDIKAPDCFIIESELKKHLNIPVFHDDQHGTAIAVLAGLGNALELQNKKIEEVKIVLNGAGAAAISCANLLLKRGALRKNFIMCDSKGVIYKGRKEGLNEWKEEYAIEDGSIKTLEDAIEGADVFLGLSVKNALSKEMLNKMAKNPIVFAMANPDPEITPDEAHAARSDLIIATGRSDYANQVNNLVAFPYIFRGALDVRASEINDEMKLAAADAISLIARKSESFGHEHILPKPWDKELYVAVSSAVAMAAIDSGVAGKEISESEYVKHLDEMKKIMSS